MATYQVRLINKKQDLDTTIEVDEETTIVDAAEENGIELPFSCHSGSCSSCVGKIVEGEVDQSDQIFLDDEQMDKGFALLCVTYPRYNCTIKTHQEPYLVQSIALNEVSIPEFFDKSGIFFIQNCYIGF